MTINLGMPYGYRSSRKEVWVLPNGDLAIVLCEATRGQKRAKWLMKKLGAERLGYL